MGREGVLKELPGGSALFAAVAEDCPDAGFPLPSHRGAAALRNAPVDNRTSNTALGDVVCRGDGRIKQESEDCLAMLVEPPGQGSGLGLFTAGADLCHIKDPILDTKHEPVEPILGNLFPEMPEVEQPLEFDKELVSEELISFTGQRGEKFDVSNQMCQAELLERVGVLDIDAEKVADDGPAVSFPENLFEHFGASSLCDDKEADKGGTEGPYPVFIAVILPAGLIDVQNRFGRNIFLKFFVGARKSTADAGDGVAQEASGTLISRTSLQNASRAL